MPSSNPRHHRGLVVLIFATIVGGLIAGSTVMFLSGELSSRAQGTNGISADRLTSAPQLSAAASPSTPEQAKTDAMQKSEDQAWRLYRISLLSAGVAILVFALALWLRHRPEDELADS